MQSISGVPVVFWPVYRAELLLSKIPTKFTNAAKRPRGVGHVLSGGCDVTGPWVSHSGIIQSVSTPSRELHNVHYIPQPLEDSWTRSREAWRNNSVIYTTYPAE